jgi:hypothetical protein
MTVSSSAVARIPAAAFTYLVCAFALRARSTSDINLTAPEREKAMFCDLVGLITITARFDPEEWRATAVP